MSLKTRLKKLEASTAASRTFVIWQKPGVDVEAETERLKREKGMTQNDLLVIISWLSGDQSRCGDEAIRTSRSSVSYPARSAPIRLHSRRAIRFRLPRWICGTIILKNLKPMASRRIDGWNSADLTVQ